MGDLPGPGLEPVSPALAGGFLTTAPPGKSQAESFYHDCAIPDLVCTSYFQKVSPKLVIHSSQSLFPKA